MRTEKDYGKWIKPKRENEFPFIDIFKKRYEHRFMHTYLDRYDDDERVHKHLVEEIPMHKKILPVMNVKKNLSWRIHDGNGNFFRLPTPKTVA